MIQKTFAATAIGAALAFASASASAVTVSSFGAWNDALPSSGSCAPSVSNTSAWGGTSEARWGCGTRPSGYDFTGISSTNYNFGDTLKVGNFNHRNYPVSGTTLTSIELGLTLNIAGSSYLMDDLRFFHQETPNTAGSCALGNLGAPCDDFVSLPSGFQGSSIQIGSDHYVLDVLGFSRDGGVSTVDRFRTLEGQQNEADLYVRLVQVQGPCVGSACNPTDPGELPVPSPLGLLMLGGAALGVSLRARRA